MTGINDDSFGEVEFPMIWFCKLASLKVMELHFMICEYTNLTTVYDKLYLYFMSLLIMILINSKF